tara:strand:+ start:1559 stop:1903 length:345 start_codon:yes stop_codon:yes gene_type:complete
MDLQFFLIWISALSFLYYGINSLVSKKMVAEYKRWGFESKRYLIAYSQIFASFALILGFYVKLLTIIFSFLLFLMMFGAMITRFRVKDSFFKTLPSIFYATINFIIFYLSINSI